MPSVASRVPGAVVVGRRAGRCAVRSVAFSGLLAWVGACAPAADPGECGVDEDCDRGQMCEVAVAECVDIPIDTTSTGTATPTFTDQVVAFHRGRVCFADKVQSGQKVPITLDPCFHPCLTRTSFHHKNYYSCLGSSCDAWAMMYIVASGDACPADAFGSFDRTMCSFTSPVELGIGSTIGENDPVQGTMTLEIPFLTNEDVQVIHAAGGDIELTQQKIEQYPSLPGRIAGDISLLSSNPAPPEMCNGAENCTCVEIGF